MRRNAKWVLQACGFPVLGLTAALTGCGAPMMTGDAGCPAVTGIMACNEFIDTICARTRSRIPIAMGGVACLWPASRRDWRRPWAALPVACLARRPHGTAGS